MQRFTSPSTLALGLLLSSSSASVNIATAENRLSIVLLRLTEFQALRESTDKTAVYAINAAAKLYQAEPARQKWQISRNTGTIYSEHLSSFIDFVSRERIKILFHPENPVRPAYLLANRILSRYSHSLLLLLPAFAALACRFSLGPARFRTRPNNRSVKRSSNKSTPRILGHTERFLFSRSSWISLALLFFRSLSLSFFP